MISGKIREFKGAIGEEREAFFTQLQTLLVRERAATFAQIKKEREALQSFLASQGSNVTAGITGLGKALAQQTIVIEGTAKIAKATNNLRW